MISYIEKQGNKIVTVVNKLSRYAASRKKSLTIVIDYSDYKFLNRKIKKEVNNVVEIIVKFNSKNFSLSNVKKVCKFKSSGRVFIDNISIKLDKKLTKKCFSDYEIVLINNSNITQVTIRNIIDESNYQDLDLFMLSCGFEERFGCAHSSCLGKRFFIDKIGNVSYCYKTKSIIGNIFKEELKTMLTSSEEFNKLLLKAIERRKKCTANCQYFSKCQGGCVLEDLDCKKFIEGMNRTKEELNQIIQNDFPLDEVHLSKENAIIKYISSVRKR